MPQRRQTPEISQAHAMRDLSLPKARDWTIMILQPPEIGDVGLDSQGTLIVALTRETLTGAGSQT